MIGESEQSSDDIMFADLDGLEQEGNSFYEVRH